MYFNSFIQEIFMKTVRLVFLAVIAAASFAAQAETINTKVNGMVCAFCAQGIEKKLRANNATQDVYVSLENKIVAVALKSGQSITDDTVKQLITDAGYTVTDISRSDTSLDDIRSAAKKK
jgi:mercuric ion binding protein